MTPEHVDCFLSHGYVHVAESVLPCSLAECIAEYDRCLVHALALGLDVDEQPIGATQIRKVGDAARASGVIAAIATSASLADMVRALTRWSEVYYWADSLYSKPPRSGGQSVLAFHQDLHYWQHLLSPDQAITAVVPLYRAQRESGGVGYVPGSHLWSLAHVRHEQPHEVFPVVEPGHVVLHHPLTLHGSRENSIGEPRRSLSIHLTCVPSLGKQRIAPR